MSNLNQDEESVAELLKLLKEADFNPDLIISGSNQVLSGIVINLALNKLKGVWNFWKKKTGNYLANKFFEDNEYFNAYRIYTALRDVDRSPVLAVTNPLSNRSLRRKAWELCTGYGNLHIN